MIKIKFSNTIPIYFSAILLLLSCKKTGTISAQKDDKITSMQKNSLEKVKDTVLFVGSTEGEDVKLFVNTKTQDSILESEVMGETGMATYKFIFNQELKSGESITLRYAEPIHINPNPKIASEEKENLQSSKESKQRLTDIFESYLQVLGKNK